MNFFTSHVLIILPRNCHCLFLIWKKINSPNWKQNHWQIFLCKAVWNKVLDLKLHRKGMFDVVHDSIKMFLIYCPQTTFSR